MTPSTSPAAASFAPAARAVAAAASRPLPAAAATATGPSDVRLAVVAALVLVGTFFLLVGTLGLLRFPDVYNRMHATSKAQTLGAASLFLAGFVRFGPWGAGLTSLVGIAFLFVTAPVGAHLISRAARRLGVPAHTERDGDTERDGRGPD